jgi:hypothetical protein
LGCLTELMRRKSCYAWRCAERRDAERKTPADRPADRPASVGHRS